MKLKKKKKHLKGIKKDTKGLIPFTICSQRQWDDKDIDLTYWRLITWYPNLIFQFLYGTVWAFESSTMKFE